MKIIEITIKGEDLTQPENTTGAGNIRREIFNRLSHTFPEMDFETYAHGILMDGKETFTFGRKTKHEAQTGE